jgi:hypothetical protein
MPINSIFKAHKASQDKKGPEDSREEMEPMEWPENQEKRLDAVRNWRREKNSIHFYSQIIVPCRKQNPDIRKEIVVQFTLNSNFIVKNIYFIEISLGLSPRFFIINIFHSIRLFD